MRLFQSTIERSLYVLLILIFIVNMAIGVEVIHVQTVQNHNHSYTNQTLTSIQKEMICIGAFFDEPGAVRSTTSIATLKACQPVVEETK